MCSSYNDLLGEGDTHMKLVTIIVPVYNVEKYLNECIQSLRMQTYKNIEIILIDDGSKDSSGEICEALADEDSRIKVIHKENAGLGYARNSGLEIARGEYVTFIDSDDVADADLISRLMKAVQDDGVDTCIGGFKRISENGNIEFSEKYEKKIYQGKDVYDKLFARMLGSAVDKHDAIRMSVWNVLYSMKIIKEHNLRFPSEREFISEDIIWDSEYYRFASKVEIIDSIAYNYRITPGSLTQKFKPNRFELSCKLYEELSRRVGNDRNKIIRLQRQFFVNIRVCLRQEKTIVSGNDRKTSKIRINQILNNNTVVKIISEYPIKSIQIKQRIFLLLLKYKMTDVIVWLNDLNSI